MAPVTVYDLSRWHATLRRDEPAVRHAETGEIRVPLSLQRLDEHAGDVELVMSRREAEHFYASLGRMLAGEPSAIVATR